MYKIADDLYGHPTDKKSQYDVVCPWLPFVPRTTCIARYVPNASGLYTYSSLLLGSETRGLWVL